MVRKVGANAEEERKFHNWPSWVIRMGSQYESEKDETFSGQNVLKGLQMVQLECPSH